MEKIKQFKEKVLENVSKVIVGKNDEIELLLTAFLAQGHILLEDLPGMGKTVMVRSFSKTLDLPFKRIQFTPDLLPGDITGISFYNQKEKEFEFRKGPLFANVILADEINRATPRTQAALLEAMEERQITVDGVTRKLSEPFIVLATQNPVETYGTFPLPEAQMDRFLMRISMGYPSLEEEKVILRQTLGNLLETLSSVVSEEELKILITEVKGVKCTDEVLSYLLQVVRATREDEEITMGVSPRGSIALFRASQVSAAFDGRDFMMPEDVKKMAPYVLNHRIVSEDAYGVASAMRKIEDLLTQVPVPLEEAGEDI
ncbi:AAA family ATPase [Proteiniclasticum ruminis]|uniref:MoxR-like ATPase n=1 Tax=Proteiniclasticum ruminis TaxID=398199 RepID=A0A1I5CI62_9CLOT|nr:MoxR family ATPase [Proteiniclasticum ruminis]SFN86705.1 MoxR-like ATPase [Proteiniclasticum ruminis]